MAVYKLFPTKDASMYSVSESMNTGIDEILDFSTYVFDGAGQVNRALIQFSSTEIVDTIDNLVGSGTAFIPSTSLSFPSPGGVAGTYQVTLEGLTSGQTNATATVIVSGGGAISSAEIANTGSHYIAGERVVIRPGALGAGSTAVTSSVIKIANLDYSSCLRLNAAVVSGLSQDATVEVYPVSGSWNMGTGKYYNNPQTQNGCSWKFKLSQGEGPWLTSGFAGGTYSTASFSSSLEGGGNWYYADPAGQDYVFQQAFSYSNPIDINIEVEPSVRQQYDYEKNPSTGQKNDGFIIKQTGSQEFLNDPNTQATFRFFSIDTNTIYPPMLEIKWDNYKFDTGSNKNGILDTNSALISVYNNNGIYYSQSIAEFRIGAAPKYPIRVFQTASEYNTNHFLPEDTSLYAIKDSETNEMIIDFDSKYTKISADSQGSYFTVYMNGLEPERDYTILIKTVIDGVTNVFDEDIRFKVVNG
tara:strand:+ start:924 stop:2336 length:1413 start_codon:yes stop_codon:yes gene_type:complete